MSVLRLKKCSSRVTGLLVLLVSIAATVWGEERRPSTLSTPAKSEEPSTGKLIEEDLPPASGPMIPPSSSLELPPASAPVNPPSTSLGLPPASGPMIPPSASLQPSQEYSAPVYPPPPALVPGMPLPGATVPLGGPVPFPSRPAVITNVSPPLPPKDSFTPEEQVALHFIEEGEAALMQNNLDRAQARFERAIAIAPFQPYGYYFLSRVAFARGAHQQALAFAHKAELLFARSDETWRGETANLKGIVYEDLGDYIHARVSYQRCLQLVPGHLKAMTALARLSEPVEDPVQPAEEPVQNVSIPQ